MIEAYTRMGMEVVMVVEAVLILKMNKVLAMFQHSSNNFTSLPTRTLRYTARLSNLSQVTENVCGESGFELRQYVSRISY